VSVEVALALVLLTGAGLLIRTAAALYTVNPGIDPNNVLTLEMSLTGRDHQTAASLERLIRTATERIEGLPGVERASASCCLPVRNGFGLPFRVIGRPLQEGPYHGGGGWRDVAPGFFEVFRIKTVRRRVFDTRDNASAQPVAVINEAMARRYWPKGDPLADRILIGKGIMPIFDPEQPRQIIGIVGDTRDDGLNREPYPTMYVPFAQVPDGVLALNARIVPVVWVFRTRGEPMAERAAIEEQLRQVSGLPTARPRVMTDIVRGTTSRQRFHMLLMSIFGGSALLLAGIGIYGLMAYSVEQRAQEIGIRMALGASGGDVRGMVIRQAMLFTGIGIVAGFAASLALARQLTSFLYGVTPWDPAVFILIPLMLALAALGAVWWPAHRATRIDPAIALRAQ